MNPPRRIIVICLRRLGDLLLATALIRSLKQAWPDARIDVLVSAGTESVLEGNPDVGAVISMRRGKGIWKLVFRLFRRYQLAVNLNPEDRAHIFGWIAAPRRAAIVPVPGDEGARWKRWISDVWRSVDLHESHAVVQYLQLADALGVPRSTQLVPPRSDDPSSLLRVFNPTEKPYAVIHAAPMYRYKAWTIDGWAELIAHFCGQGLRIAMTGAPADCEMVGAIIAASSPGSHVTNLAGLLTLGELTLLLEHATVYVGPDTSITHLAAACGTPTVALFGPSNPSAWGPWPQGVDPSVRSPWIHTSSMQHFGNVWLVQGTHERRPGCIPCMQEGCERRRASTSDCLDYLSASAVIAAVNQAHSRKHHIDRENLNPGMSGLK